MHLNHLRFFFLSFFLSFCFCLLVVVVFFFKQHIKHNAKNQKAFG